MLHIEARILCGVAPGSIMQITWYGIRRIALGLAGLGLAPWFALALLALGLMGMMDVLAFTLKQSLIPLSLGTRWAAQQLMSALRNHKTLSLTEAASKAELNRKYA